MSDQEKIKELEAKLAAYEQNGPAKLYYSLNRKMNEMGNLLNKTDLSTVDLESKDSKEFDRLFKLLEKSQVISTAAQSVKEFAGISGEEYKDVTRKPFRTSPESIADQIGNTAGQNM